MGKTLHYGKITGIPFGVLSEVYPPRVIYDSSLPLHAKVPSVICGEEWTWPAARSDSLVEIQVALCDKFQPCSVHERSYLCWL